MLHPKWNMVKCEKSFQLKACSSSEGGKGTKCATVNPSKSCRGKHSYVYLFFVTLIRWFSSYHPVAASATVTISACPKAAAGKDDASSWWKTGKISKYCQSNINNITNVSYVKIT